MTPVTSQDRPLLRALSLGAGVQSTTLALMAARGVIGPMVFSFQDECEGMYGT